MKKINVTALFLAALIIMMSACKKNSVNFNQVGSNKQLYDNHIAVKLSENLAINNFETALTNNSNTTLSDLVTPSFQSTSDYIELSNASVDLLQTANILDSIKSNLNISNNSDPRLIFAAQIIKEMVDAPPPLDPQGNVPGWLNCAVQAGIGISLNTLKTLTAGGTLAAVGEAISQMGYKWFAKTLGKAVGKAISGIGGAFILAEFSWCMVAEYGNQVSDDDIDLAIFVSDGVLYPNVDNYHPYFAQYNNRWYYYPSISVLTVDVNIPSIDLKRNIHFNHIDNKYYSDFNFTNLVPDGYYRVGVPVYYYIVNGIPIMKYSTNKNSD